tara:strand:- start:1690 stop:2301 length:612 start_codon:yes stop_codon:yes gene_type:complete
MNSNNVWDIKAVRERRKLLNKTQSELAKEINITVNAYLKIEKGIIRNPKPKIKNEINKALGITGKYGSTLTRYSNTQYLCECISSCDKIDVPPYPDLIDEHSIKLCRDFIKACFAYKDCLESKLNNEEEQTKKFDQQYKLQKIISKFPFYDLAFRCYHDDTCEEEDLLKIKIEKYELNKIPSNDPSNILTENNEPTINDDELI